MEISKRERHVQEMNVFQLRNEGGLQALRAWLYREQAEVNDKWPRALLDQLPRLQGEASICAKLIRMIDIGPTIKTLGDDNG